MSGFTESFVEQAALAWVERLGWSVKHCLEIAPGEPGAERVDYAQVVLETRLREAPGRLNPQLPGGSVGGCLPAADTPRSPERLGLALRSAVFGVGDQPNINLAISREDGSGTSAGRSATA